MKLNVQLVKLQIVPLSIISLLAETAAEIVDPSGKDSRSPLIKIENPFRSVLKSS